MNNSETKTTHNLFAQNIIKTGAKQIFSKNKTMACLVKSEYFFKELLELFNTLNSYEISPSNFSKIINPRNFSKTDLERLLLICKLYDFYLKTMNENDFILPKKTLAKETKNFEPQNKEIKKRLDYLLERFEQKQNSATELRNSDNIEYIHFSDIQNESEHVIEAIKKLVEKGICSYSQIGVFVDKTEARQKFLDLMKSENIPVISSIYDENYENLKHKISVYHKISEVCLGLGLKEFCADSFKKIALPSKAEKEILFEKLDEIIKNLLYEVFENDSNLDKITIKQEQSTNLSLLESVFALWSRFPESDQKLLAIEFGTIKAFYEDYKNENYAQAASGLIKRFYRFFEDKELIKLVEGKIKSLNELQNLYSNILQKKPDFESFLEILEWLPPDKTNEGNAITLASISKETGKTFQYVFVSGLTENNFPGKNPSYPYISPPADEFLAKELKKLSDKFEYFLKTDKTHFRQRFYALCSLMEKTTEKIVFTTHSYESKKQVQPSTIFKILCEVDSCNFKKIENKSKINSQEIPINFEPTSLSPTEEIIHNDDMLKLNASSIATFQKCPRKYYYKNLLNLKESSTFSASYGNVVHAVLEALNRRYLNSFNRETTLDLAQVLFDSKNNEEKTLNTGFKQTDIDLIKETDELSLAEMKDNFLEAVLDLDMCGYFDEAPEMAICEKAFSFKLDKIPNVIFDGRIDVISSYQGKLRVVDYKTGKNKENSLTYAISENGVCFKTDKGKEPSNVETYINRYDYQIPLYYFACKYSDDLKEYKDKIKELGLLYVRPKKKDNGCHEDFVKAEKIEFYEDKIIQNLKETVVDKIFNATEFKKSSGWGCENCAFKFLCDEENGEDDDD